MKICLAYLLIIPCLSISAQVPDEILQKAMSYVDSMQEFHGTSRVLTYNCQDSKVLMVNQSWPGCPVKATDSVPDLEEYHELNLFEQYEICFNLQGHVAIPRFTNIRLDRFGNIIGADWFLSDDPVKNYNGIRYGHLGAIDIAKRLGLAGDPSDWMVELRFDLPSGAGIEKKGFYWFVADKSEESQKCGTSFNFMCISAESGKLLYDATSTIKCID